MEPMPLVVSQTVRALLDSVLPESESDRREWFDTFGLTPQVPLEGFNRWGTGIPGWGATTTCWGMAAERFTGVSWFLWEEGTPEERAIGRAELEVAFREAFGEPVLRAVTGHAGWLEWTTGDVVIELCAGEPQARRVQLHLVRAEQADEDLADRSCLDDPPSRCCDDDVFDDD